MTCWIIEHSHGHPLKNQKILFPNEYPCIASSQGKLIFRSSLTNIIYESPVFLERIHGDICGPIHPPYEPFHYFMILIDIFTRWSHVCLISTCNVAFAFAILLAQMIILWAQFLDYPIKTISLDNAGEFTSQTFIDYCVGINIEHPIAHTHTQNGLAESFIKHL